MAKQEAVDLAEERQRGLRQFQGGEGAARSEDAPELAEGRGQRDQVAQEEGVDGAVDGAVPQGQRRCVGHDEREASLETAAPSPSPCARRSIWGEDRFR